MPNPFELVTARTWQAKSGPRRLAEMQYLQDRDNAEYARESWKTLRQLMYNDLQNAMDSHDMVSKYGPSNWGQDLYMLGSLNNRLAALSTVPPYVAQKPTFPMPVVNEVAPLVPHPMPALPVPAIAPAPMVPAAPVAPIAPVAPLLTAAPVLPVLHAPAPVMPLAPTFFNNMPVSVGPHIMGFTIIQIICPLEAIAPAAAHFDIALQRLTAVEGLAEKAALMGGNGVVNLRLVTTPIGDVIATGDAVTLMPVPVM